MKKMILEYHLVDDIYHDYNNIAISPKNFCEQIKYLKTNCKIVAYEDFLKNDINTPDTSLHALQVALTFDDGFGGFVEKVYPILKRFELPAILFPITENLMQPSENWMNEIHRLILDGKDYPESFKLKTSIYEYEFTTKDIWKRFKLYDSIKVILKDLNAGERKAVLQALRIWGSPDEGPRREYLSITAEGCKMISADGLVQIGAHTQTHPALEDKTYEEQYFEISNSKTYLENLLRTDIVHFSYPFGSYDGNTIEILKRLGFVSACTSKREMVNDLTEQGMYELPRFPVPNCGADEFEIWLNRVACIGSEKVRSVEETFVVYVGRMINDEVLRKTERKVLIFGAGKTGTQLLEQITAMNMKSRIKGFIDNDCSKQGKMKCGFRIFAPEEIKLEQYGVVVWKHAIPILNQLKEMNAKSVHLITGL